ncbi:uncharacterized protein PFL1_03197 [Pseudozyma flocculosa PF-1]|nr:uncharacterized protein PFL1_03197 [Pseudozyma flocculosa PF-1]EPQ29442.1 hypothetical protein PFL1_03197 [Pseudozyma flocculosa PF-1]
MPANRSTPGSSSATLPLPHEILSFRGAAPLDSPQVLIHDLDALVHSQHHQRLERQRQQPPAALAPHTLDPAWHDDYHSFQEIADHLLDLEHAYPSHARRIQIATTHEGRPIYALKLAKRQPAPPNDGDDDGDGDGELSPQKKNSKKNKGKKGGDKKKKKKKHRKPEPIGIVIAAEQHAREWISTSTSLFFASELLRSALGSPHPQPHPHPGPDPNPNPDPNPAPNPPPSNSDDNDDDDDEPDTRLPSLPWSRKQARRILERFSLTVIPLSNPDGYVHSWDENRMWRKNRQPTTAAGDEAGCVGVDLNRNWGFHFDAGLNPCSEAYAGDKAFDAIETRAMAQYIDDPANGVEGFIDLHSYGQLLTYPYSFSCSEAVGDEEDLLEVSLGAVRALRNVHKRTFTSGRTCEVVGEAGGNAIDWTYSVKWSFSLELRDGGTYGFLLPPEQIRPTGEETGAALVYLLDFIHEREKDKQKSGHHRLQ